MGYFYEFELVLAGIILLSTMSFVGIRLWLKRRQEEVTTDSLENKEQNM